MTAGPPSGHTGGTKWSQGHPGGTMWPQDHPGGIKWPQGYPGGQCGHRTTLVVLSGRGAISVVLSGQMATLVKLSGIIVPPRAHSCVHLGLPSGLRPPKRNQSATWITQADLGPSKWHWEDASECLWGHPCGLRSSKVALGPSECHLGHPSGLRSTQMAWVRPRGTREPPGPRLAL